MVSGAMLLAGLGSVMMIASEVANTPDASTRRLEAAEAVNELSNDVRFATYFIEHSAHVLDFVVADRTNDGTAERIRYAWSGVPGDAAVKTVQRRHGRSVVDSVQDFQPLTSSLAARSTSLHYDRRRRRESLLASYDDTVLAIKKRLGLSQRDTGPIRRPAARSDDVSPRSRPTPSAGMLTTRRISRHAKAAEARPITSACNFALRAIPTIVRRANCGGKSCIPESSITGSLARTPHLSRPSTQPGAAPRV